MNINLKVRKVLQKTVFIFYLQAVSTTEWTSSIFDCEPWLMQSKEQLFLVVQSFLFSCNYFSFSQTHIKSHYDISSHILKIALNKAFSSEKLASKLLKFFLLFLVILYHMLTFLVILSKIVDHQNIQNLIYLSMDFFIYGRDCYI